MTDAKEWAIALLITFVIITAIYSAWLMSIILIIASIAYGVKVSQEVDRE